MASEASDFAIVASSEGSARPASERGDATVSFSASTGTATVRSTSTLTAGGAPAAGRIAIVGAGPAAVKAALDLTDGGAAVTLIHEAPLSAAPERLAALDAAAAKAASPDNDADNAGRLTILAGTLEAVEAPEGRLLTLHVAGTGGHGRIGADYILVQAGLELIDGALTGMEPVIDLSTGETANPGLFVLGDAASGGGRLAEASFADGARAASALSRRLSAPLAPGFRLGAA